MSKREVPDGITPIDQVDELVESWRDADNERGFSDEPGDSDGDGSIPDPTSNDESDERGDDPADSFFEGLDEIDVGFDVPDGMGDPPAAS